MTRSTLLKMLYKHAFEIVQFAEFKNNTLIVFNKAEITGMAFTYHSELHS